MKRFAISISNGGGYVILAALAVAVAIRAYQIPLPTFDRLLYAATVAHLHTSDPVLIAQEAVQSAGKTDYPHTPFSDQLLAQPTLIVEQIPFYVNRPLYIYALSIVGLRSVSPLSYLGVVLILTLWTRSPWWVIPIAVLPDLVEVAREITPDALAAFVVLSALLLLKRNYMGTVLVILLLSLGIRPDNLFFLLPVLGVLVWRKKLDWRLAVGCAVLGAVGAAIVAQLKHSYGWVVLMRHSFSGGLVHPAMAGASISPRDYLGYLVHGVTGVLSVCSLWVLLGAVIWRYSKQARDFLMIAAIFCILHIFVFPISEPRYFVTAFLLVCALFVDTFVNNSLFGKHKNPMLGSAS